MKRLANGLVLLLVILLFYTGFSNMKSKHDYYFKLLDSIYTIKMTEGMETTTFNNIAFRCNPNENSRKSEEFDETYLKDDEERYAKSLLKK